MTEWLEADGLGGFAMGTADGIRTRRYHALLLTAVRPPGGRMVLVADVEVVVETAAGRYALSSHRYRDNVVHPDGVTHLSRFEWEPWPRWEWTLPDGSRVACEIVVERGSARVALRWTRLSGTVTALHVQPLLAGRDYHATHHENPAFRFDAELAGERVTWQPYPGVPRISCVANGLYQHAPDWYRGFVYIDEQARGLDDVEDLATPGVFTFDLAAGHAAMVFAADAIDSHAAALVEGMFTREARRRARLPSPLVRAADAYLVARDGGTTIIAGYPWFADWGSDTFVALRGLCLATGRRAEARAVLAQWAGTISQGMLPNRFDEATEAPAYNSVDAALWFVIAADAYLAGDATEDDRRSLRSAIAAIVDGLTAGSRHGIRVDADGLLACGEPGVQLTWMDAKVDGQVITARVGKPVEIQALWINALAIAGRDAEVKRARAAFAKFWDAERGQLYDVIDCDHVAGKVDPSCRPNQIFAIGGLRDAVLDGERARAVVDTVERELVTPAGLRTLAPSDPRYQGRYLGDASQRDRSYHNGAVWPWLSGAFVEAWLRVRGGTLEARREARRRFVDPLLARITIAGLGHLPELCDGDPPHLPRGCPFQAWSVAEALRLLALV
jgi:predicted glycogen debranching enzyme